MKTLKADDKVFYVGDNGIEFVRINTVIKNKNRGTLYHLSNGKYVPSSDIFEENYEAQLFWDAKFDNKIARITD